MEQLFEIITLEWKKTTPDKFPGAPGVYQVYGTSPLYGVDTLLYIGKATNLNDRIKAHFDPEVGVLGRQPNKTCRFAEVPAELLDVVEQILIVMHKPSFNAASLKRVSQKLRENAYYLQNHGDRGMLNLENTNFYFLANVKLKELPDVAAAVETEDIS